MQSQKKSVQISFVEIFLAYQNFYANESLWRHEGTIKVLLIILWCVNQQSINVHLSVHVYFRKLRPISNHNYVIDMSLSVILMYFLSPGVPN